MLRGGWFGPAGRFPLSLLRNNGDGTFTDVTERAGLLTAHPTQTAVWLDYDGDGWLDLFIGNESTPGNTHPCELFHNNRDGTFTECAAKCGVDIVGFVKGVASADYNNDGRPDILRLADAASNPTSFCATMAPRDPVQSEAGWKFTDVTEVAGVAEPIASFPCWFFDYDNDGWPDIFVCGYCPAEPSNVAAEYLGVPERRTAPAALSQQRRRNLYRRGIAAGLNMTLLGMAGQFRRPRQRRLPRFLHRHRRAELHGSGPESHVPQRRRQAVSGCDDFRRVRSTCRKDTGSPSPTSTTTGSRTSTR